MNVLSSLKVALLYGVFASIVVLASRCSSDDPVENAPDVFWEEARLKDFPLNEVVYLDISIVHPEVVNGVETKAGKIEITIPRSQTSLMLSLKKADLDNNKYNVSPFVGEQKDFSKGAVRYTISATNSPTKVVHYDVNVVYGGAPFFVNAKVTGFAFEKSKNPGLDATIDAVKIMEYDNYSENAIYVIVPEGTDFSKLTPTVTYDAAKLFYTTGSGFDLYPANGTSIDFSYPKHFYLQAENSLGTKSKNYNVIVDIKDPIRFDSPITTANVKTGDGIAVENFFAIATWTNRGNHPITGMSPVQYKDKIYPIPNYPGDANIVTTSIHNPNGGTVGVLPGEKGEINVRVKRSPIAGLFSTTAVFEPTFSFDTRIISYWPVDDRVEGIFGVQTLVIQTTLED
ncbi:hypothetical protein [Chryseolinea lacunae]|uniref:DUF1735 domain-containing protein n=1 Tax=Chryseolinea lacunae TaxID=2801331 RepID=A0ABS1KQF9_9BACT|nr:hypothetical protein [Chryseolinea lacunae]MBL0741433.1 hypothetical protein [Chryseolinea lacunae]